MPAGPSRAPAEAARLVDALTPVVTGVVERAGFVLDGVEVRPAGRRQVVQVTVDTVDAPGVDDGPAPGADLDAVAAVSRELSTTLDERTDAPASEYTLEVTTPGTDRPLTDPRHWRRAWLRRVTVTGSDGRETAGRVGPVADDGTVTLAVTDRRGVVALETLAPADVGRAVVDVEFKPAPQGEVDALREARRAQQTREDRS